MQNAIVSDSDVYICDARNKFDKDSVSAELVVRGLWIHVYCVILVKLQSCDWL